MASILIVEDDIEIAQMIEFILRKEGFQPIHISSTCKEALEHIKKHYDTYILDVNLPDGTGYDIAKVIRTKSKAPILYVSAKVTDEDKLKGFNHGADDYITKPFNPLLLAARVKANAERYVRDYRNIDFYFDEKKAELIINNKTHYLSGNQYLLMQYLYENQNKVLTREEIYEAVWNNRYIDDITVMVHISKLREKIEEDPTNPKRLLTVRKVGYILKVGLKDE